MKKIRWMFWCRRVHLYLGCFFTPLLLFYILSGGFQTVNEERLKDVSEAETFVQKMRAVHTDHVYPSETEFKNPSNPRLFKFITVVMCVLATVMIFLGLILAFKTIKKKWLVAVVLVAGFLLPALMLKLGQGAGKPVQAPPPPALGAP